MDSASSLWKNGLRLLRKGIKNWLCVVVPPWGSVINRVLFYVVQFFWSQELIRVLLDWINDELHTERIIVQDVEEDLYDGQVRAAILILNQTGDSCNLDS